MIDSEEIAPDTAPRPCRLCGASNFKPVYFLDQTAIVRCRGCSLIQTAQAPTLTDLQGYYAHLGHDYHAPRSEFERARILRASHFRLGYFQRYTGLRGGKVLEVGSAEGTFLSLLRDRGFEVLGLEPSTYWAEQHRLRDLPVITALLEQADLPEGAFEAVCLFQVFEHFEEPREAARILHRILKPGGFLVLEVPDIFSVGAKFEKRPHRLFNPEHICYFSRETLDALLVPLGFTPVAARHYDYDGLRLPFGKSLKKILVPLFNPHFKGPLERILEQEIDLRFQSVPQPVNTSEVDALPPVRSTWGRNLRKALTLPLDAAFGYLAYLLDRGASLFWIGRKL